MAKRRAAQDDLLSAKQIPSQSSSADASRISVSSLALAGQAKYDSLQFDVGCTVSKGAHVIVGCKVCWLQAAVLACARDVDDQATPTKLRHWITFLSRYFPESVSTVAVGVRYS